MQPQVKTALTQLLRRERLHHLPLFALGASSGGAFVLALASELPLTGVVSQIMALPPHMLTAFVERRRVNGLGGAYPPVMFVHMPRDEHTASLAEQNMQLLTEQVSRHLGQLEGRQGRWRRARRLQVGRQAAGG